MSISNFAMTSGISLLRSSQQAFGADNASGAQGASGASGASGADNASDANEIAKLESEALAKAKSNAESMVNSYKKMTKEKLQELGYLGTRRHGSTTGTSYGSQDPNTGDYHTCASATCSYTVTIRNDGTVTSTVGTPQLTRSGKL